MSAKKKNFEERIQEILTEAMALRKEIEGLADKDAEVFEPLSRAYGLPRETRAEKEHKEQIMEKCLYAASQVPIELMAVHAVGVVGMSVSHCRLPRGCRSRPGRRPGRGRGRAWPADGWGSWCRP